MYRANNLWQSYGIIFHIQNKPRQETDGDAQAVFSVFDYYVVVVGYINLRLSIFLNLKTSFYNPAVKHDIIITLV